MQKFRKALRRLPDPRTHNARHDLLEVLFIALAATLCGAESCSDMADFGQSKEGLLRLFLRLEHGIPSHDTFSRVFRLLKPQAFELAFRRFMAAFAKANGLKLKGPARGLRTRRKGHPAASGQRLCGGCPHGLGSAKGIWSQRDGGRFGSAGPSVVGRLHRYCRCAALYPRVCAGGAEIAHSEKRLRNPCVCA